MKRTIFCYSWTSPLGSSNNDLVTITGDEVIIEKTVSDDTGMKLKVPLEEALKFKTKLRNKRLSSSWQSVSDFLYNNPMDSELSEARGHIIKKYSVYFFR